MLVVEVVGALALAAVVLAIFAAATLQYGAAEREYDLRRVLLAAASAELDRIRVGARPLPGLDEAPPTPESNEIVVRVTARPGEGPWEGLVRVRVEASKRVRMDRVARVELSGYVEREERR
ncbi:MAG: hypothetical protein CHACPFDD_03420 [Phycisphaerae bacterium]|nr:hypothetical protein [Phycisphaerae bacterium]